MDTTTLETEQSMHNFGDFIKKQALNAIEFVIKDKRYNVNDAQSWGDQICDDILVSVTSVNKNFKLIVCCTILQKAPLGLNMSTSCFWNGAKDGNVTIKKDYPDMICIVNVYGCLIE